MTIKVILGGPRGKMGAEAIKMMMNDNALELVAVIDRKHDGELLQDIDANYQGKAKIYEDAAACFTESQADVYIDLTIPGVGYDNTYTALTNGLHAVVGTSGFSDEQLESLENLANKQEVGCVIAPNFALGAVLMMLFTKMAAKYFPDVEIIEKHHEQKLDAPSGTAMKTLDLIQEVRNKDASAQIDDTELIAGARGGNVDGIRVHSMRLPGLVAHQEVVFGSKSQLLTIKHDSFHRESFMDGLKLAVEKVVDIKGLIYGLEHIMDLNE